MVINDYMEIMRMMALQSSRKTLQMQMLHKNMFLHACTPYKINCNGKFTVKVINIKIVIHGKMHL